jgi:hypothetical protein
MPRRSDERSKSGSVNALAAKTKGPREVRLVKETADKRISRKAIASSPKFGYDYCSGTLETERNAMANWSLCGKHAGPDKTPTPIFINLDNVLTVERESDLTTVIMVGGEKVYIDTMPETLIGTAPPAGPV